MGKLKNKRFIPPIAAQILSAFAFAAALALAFASDQSYGTQPDSNEDTNPQPPQIHQRWKRDLTGNLFDAADKVGIGGSYLKKFRTLLEGTPPTVQDAFIKGDFSNVTESDIRGMNVSVLEYIPAPTFTFPKIIAKMSNVSLPLLTPIIEKFLDFNRPNALGRLMSVAGDKFDSNTLIDKVKQHGGVTEKNEASSVLLYHALNKLGDKDGITTQNLRSLSQDGLLQLVPEEQLMKVKDAGAAKFLLNSVYRRAEGTELDDVDDKALIYQLANTAYGPPSQWSQRSLNDISPQIIAQMPSTALKELSPDVVSQSIGTLRNTKFNAVQAKTIADIFLEKSGLKKDGAGNLEGETQNLNGIMSSLGNLAAFVNPSVSKESSVMHTIINACEKLNLPAPIQAVTSYLKSKTQGKKLDELGVNDLKEMGIAVIKNGPPQLLSAAIKTQSLDQTDLQDIATTRTESGSFGSSFLQGLISQVSTYAIKYFTRGGRIDFSSLPAAFMGALGIKGINNMGNRDIENALEQLRKNPDALDDAQKALLLKKLKDEGMLDSNVAELPPEFRALLPRSSPDKDVIPMNILDGLPSDAELRLAHGQKAKITAKDLERDKFLVGTLTPKQVEEFDLADIPAVLSAVRKSKDGPQPQTLKALANRFKQYIQLKSEDYEVEDKKLLKYISAAEVSKIPATVLAYFIDPRQTRKLPADVRKEIMIALGELSTKDHASIPAKTREEIILQGLAALDEKLDSEKKLGVPELAAIGAGVADLPPNRIEKLTPVAVEQALEIIQGTADDDDDGLKQRSCLNPAQKKAWREKIVQIYGAPESWDPATVSSLCCSLALLEENDLHLIPKNILTCRCPSDEDPPSHLKELKKALNANCKHELGVDQQEPKKILEKVKSEVSLDFEDLESQIIGGRRRRRRRRDGDGSDGDSLNCFQLRITGSALPFEKEQLESIPDDDLPNCIYDVGREPLPSDIARSMWEKFVKARGGVENVSANDFLNLGHVLSGIRQEDVQKLNMADPDVVKALGKPLRFSKNTLEKLANHLEEKIAKTLQVFDSTDLVTANNILCGFSPEKIRQIRSDSFREALPVLKSIDPSCELTRLASLTAIATRTEVLGDPQNWTRADVRAVGTLFNGLPDVTQIPAEAFLGVTPTVAESLPEAILTNLTPEQLRHLPRFSAQSLSEEQVNMLTADGQNALDVQGPLVADSTVTIKYCAATYMTLAITAILTHRIL